MTAAAHALILRGSPVAAAVRAEVEARFARLRERRVIPGLAIVTVGEPPAGNPYVRAKVRAATALGAEATVHRLAASTREEELNRRLADLNADPSVHGVIVQLPLPPELVEDHHLEIIAPEKDLDGFHPFNVGRMVQGRAGHRPATPLGVVRLLRHYVGDLTGRRVVVVGRSRIVGRPLSILLSERSSGLNATVTLCHSESRPLQASTREAEILIVAMGRPRAIGPDHVRPGAVVVDVGIHPIADPAPGGPKYEGDVDFAAVEPIASAITPVPGGVGPMTVAMLLRNLADACERIAGAT